MKRTFLILVSVLAPLVPVWGQSAEQKQATVVYLQGLQRPEGGFVPQAGGSGQQKCSLRATSAAVRALKYFGAEPRDRKGAANFVASCFDKASGGFGDAPGGTPDVALTAVGLMAAVEFKLPLEEYSPSAVAYMVGKAKTFEEIRIAAAGLEAVRQRPPIVDTWLKEVAKLQRANGAYGDGGARDTGGAAVVVLRLGAMLEDRDRVIDTLKTGQRGDGGFAKSGARGSDLESTYRIMRCFMMLKEKPTDVGALRRFLASCRNADGGYGTEPGQPSSISGVYYVGIINQWLGDF